MSVYLNCSPNVGIILVTDDITVAETDKKAQLSADYDVIFCQETAHMLRIALCSAHDAALALRLSVQGTRGGVYVIYTQKYTDQ